MTRLIVVAGARAVAEAAADRVVVVLGGAIEVRGVAHVALTGGSTAEGLYRALLAPARRPAVDWSKVEVWWGDDRLVARSDALSNVRAAEPILDPDSGLGLDPRRVHPIPIDEARELGNDPAWIAATYAARLREGAPAGDDGIPLLDLVLLGLGTDGHILSVFPGSAALAPDAPLVLDVPAPTHIEPRVARVTISPRLVSSARAVMVMVSGASKAASLAEALGGPLDPARVPGQLACGPNATWIVDRAAAAELDGRA
jgi:6-phosphogluconolactonase